MVPEAWPLNGRSAAVATGAAREATASERAMRRRGRVMRWFLTMNDKK